MLTSLSLALLEQGQINSEYLMKALLGGKLSPTLSAPASALKLTLSLRFHFGRAGMNRTWDNQK